MATTNMDIRDSLSGGSSTNHKDIGILYLFTAAAVGFLSVAFTVYMRMELMNPRRHTMCMEGQRFVASTARHVRPMATSGT